MTVTADLVERVKAQLAHGRAHGMEAVAIDVADLERIIALAEDGDRFAYMVGMGWVDRESIKADRVIRFTHHAAVARGEVQ